MLKRLHIKNFTVFADADFEFGPGLNVLVGTNGTGKTHVLKLGYSIETTKFDISRQLTADQLANDLTKSLAWTSGLYRILPDVFLSSQLAPLIRWDVNNQSEINVDFGTSIAELLSFKLTPASLDLGQKTSSIGDVVASPITEDTFRPVFIPAKEILTLSWMLPGSEQLIAPIEKTYLNLLNQLRLLPLRKPESAQAIQALTDILGGELREDKDNYYLVSAAGRRTAISMVAEGFRKFGTLQKLLANGSLTKSTTLYWDEPEANLNPALLRELAAILAELARQGFQIILATHSTDLLKEFHILSRHKDAKPLPIKYFGLNAGPGEATRVVTTDNFEYLPDVVALAEELKQADELEEIFIREDREYYANNRGEQPSL
ncbi:AAA family ATPase [Hymenobacter coccineus]|uniref:AAA family ATPase n=1 Tax=Hymenobacter coccineus TaxID=1908235 RepID=UPI0009F33904|nr:AAA family ATPase [Hymenobacter coccineus]